ncbi:unnamed protein product [Polarella glacialis]|uniref:Reverse transcriptase domain-containing protein n=1 Tax=Polarella glacialis TaxID=89957 RepID=A0A813J2G0_POLGL|nr:unnamed protein product [Polarella glacialis]
MASIFAGRVANIWKQMQSPESPAQDPNPHFDAPAASRAASETRAFQRTARAATLRQPYVNCFHFKELCDAQAAMHPEAETSPVDSLPIAVAPLQTEEGSIDGHRPISLMAAIFQALDKLLHARVWPAIQRSVAPWQGGGSIGADLMAWIVSELIRLRRDQYPDAQTFAAFLDGESAFCRPPAPTVLEPLSKIDGISFSDWLAVQAMLSNLHGTACIMDTIAGLWKVMTGLAQGGALSQTLFCATLIELKLKLERAGCGVHFRNADDKPHLMCILAHIDDIVLFADCPNKLQQALLITWSWANKMRMRLNAGTDKSAIMIVSRRPQTVMSWRPQNIPTTDLEWRAFIRTWQKEVRQCDGEVKAFGEATLALIRLRLREQHVSIASWTTTPAAEAVKSNVRPVRFGNGKGMPAGGACHSHALLMRFLASAVSNTESNAPRYKWAEKTGIIEEYCQGRRDQMD